MMRPSRIEVPVRFTGSDASQSEFVNLTLDTNKTALLLVDCDGDCGEACNTVIKTKIGSALHAARTTGIKGVFIYNNGWLPDGPASRGSEYHRLRRKRPVHREIWRPGQPRWMDCIEPLDDEPTIAKKAQNAFTNSYLDTYLRSWAIETVLIVGFSFKSCLFYTIVGAVGLHGSATLNRGNLK
jgi:nicotinamidase-related amidase